MAEGVLIGPQLAADLQVLVDHFKRSGLPGLSPMNTAPVITKTPIYFKNVSGETIPAYACMQVTNTVEEGPQNFLEVEKPADTDGSAGQFIFNGPSQVLNNGTGIAQDSLVVRAFKNTGTVTAGGLWGPTVGQWYLTSDAGSYVAAGEDDIATNVFKVFVSVGGGGGSKLMAAKLNENWTAKQATSDIYRLDGVNVFYVETAEVYDPLQVFRTLGTGDWLYITKQDGKYYAPPNSDCPGGSPLIDTPPESGPPGEGV